jgi:biotin carboxylase
VTPRILIIDGHGGPSPADYVRSLSPLAELRAVCLTPPFPKDAREKERVLSAAGELTVVGQPQEVLDAAVRVARSWRPDGLFAQSECILYNAARAAERLQLPFYSPRTADLLRRKDLQRAALRSAGMPCPRTALLDDGTDPWVALASVGLPAVLKPVTGVGSISTTLIESKEDLLAAREEAAQHYRADPRMYGREPVFLLESLLIGERWHKDERYGDHVSVESLAFEGRIHHLAVTDKLPLAPPFRETGDIMPSTLPAIQQQLLFDAAADAIRALGIRIGAVHTEFKLTADGPRVIEVNGRVGGGVPRLLALSAGYDVLADVGRMAIGAPPLANPRFHRFALFLTPVSPVRDVVVQAVHGEAEARALDGVADLVIRYPPGSRPNWRMGGTTSLYRAFVTSQTAEDLFEVAERIRRTVKIELEDAA